MKGWNQEQQEMERVANKVTRGCGLFSLIIAILAALVCLIVKIL